MATDQQVVAWAVGGDPRPGIPALSLRAGAGATHLPTPPVLKQPGDRVRAADPRAGECDHERAGRAQDIRLAPSFQELAQFGATAVHLVTADEVEAEIVGVGVGEHVDGQLSLGAKDQVRRQACGRRRGRVGDLLGGDPLARPDQRVPDLLAHV
ncbi:hypothetical protein KGA66_20205 [Actinocrinis puniceicyclus]|uniref:Uncharacterized protein n=1 Tax=Actinocrinis puniceicyclus TaxID=977794 RepID=A0A8J7WTG1_9ACTN|nr:hypothetical protein [Actinocrinis puniceicyclus]MBS2965385.1 hypothetical protein [Actinocrinis puniceicyclus]